MALDDRTPRGDRRREPDPSEPMSVTFGQLSIQVSVKPGEHAFQVLRREIAKLHRALQTD